MAENLWMISIVAYATLGAAILSLWFGSRFAVWGSLLAVASILAGASGRLNGVGGAAILGFLVLVYSFSVLEKKSKSRFPLYGLFLVILSSGFLLGAHWVPGFQNWKVIEAVVSLGSRPVSLYLNFDKAVIGLILLGFGPFSFLKGREAVRILGQCASLIGLMCLTLLGSAAFVKGVTWDPKWPSFTPLFLAVNLLFVCVAEEAFFRGFILRFLAKSFGKAGGRFRVKKLGIDFTSGEAKAWILSSLVFGFAHYKGGLGLVALASVAGLFYGAAFLKTRRIEAAIVTHFSLNVIHFLFFTYP